MRQSEEFTRTNVRQVTNLIERGKTPKEIADIIGVPLGTLTVSCSRFGINLQRRHDLPLAQKSHQDGNTVVILREPQTIKAHLSGVQLLPELNAKPAIKSDAVEVILSLRYRGQEQRCRIPMDRNMLGLVALEAELRSVRMEDLIADLLRSIAENDMFANVLAH